MNLNKAILIFLAITFLTTIFIAPVKAVIKKIDEMTPEELIEYGKQMQKKKDERKELKRQETEEANRLFEESLRKEKIANFCKIFIPFFVLFVFIIILIFLVVKFKKNKGKIEYL